MSADQPAWCTAGDIQVFSIPSMVIVKPEIYISVMQVGQDDINILGRSSNSPTTVFILSFFLFTFFVKL